MDEATEKAMKRAYNKGYDVLSSGKFGIRVRRKDCQGHYFTYVMRSIYDKSVLRDHLYTWQPYSRMLEFNTSQEALKYLPKVTKKLGIAPSIMEVYTYDDGGMARVVQNSQ